MRRGWTILLSALALAGCHDQQAEYDQACMRKASNFRARDYVNQNTGRIDRDPTTNEIIDPETYEIAVTRSEERCIQRGLELIIGRYEGNGSADNGTVLGADNGAGSGDPGNAM